MEKRKISNLLALAVLSLLTERPMHPYEMASVMQARGVSSIIKLNNSSLYSTIDVLLREKLIVPVETRREGRYPERTTYTTTEAGRAELYDWIRSLLSKPVNEYSQFVAGLAFLGHLPPSEVVIHLTGHIQHLKEEASSIDSEIGKALQMGVDRLFLIEQKYTLTIVEAKVLFMQQLIQEINDGTLTEASANQRVWKITRPDLAQLGSEPEGEQVDKQAEQ
jgi:DNA-binding PadR family transcriptional regulator